MKSNGYTIDLSQKSGRKFSTNGNNNHNLRAEVKQNIQDIKKNQQDRRTVLKEVDLGANMDEIFNKMETSSKIMKMIRRK